MNLDEEQKRTVSAWIEQGLKLSEIQNRLAAELGIRLTYMDVRFLIDDLKLKLKDTEPPKPSPPLAPLPGQPSAPIPAPGPPPPGEPAPLGPAVTVKVDQVTKPGSLASGKVTFSDGKAADWYLDQYGRLGLVAEEQGYRPSQEDVADFQAELQEQLAKLGY